MNVTLKKLSIDDSKEYTDLVKRNLAHLTKHGDFNDYEDYTLEKFDKEINEADDKSLLLAVIYEKELIGRVDLKYQQANIYSIGYWISSEYSGRGLMKEALRLALEKAVSKGAKEVYAGVTKGNDASENLLFALGFVKIKDMGSYNRYKFMGLK